MPESRDLITGAIPDGVAPALVIVDMSIGFTSSESPLGGNFDSVIAVNNRLIGFFAERDWPVFCSTVVYSNEQEASVFRRRLPDLNILQRGSHWVEIDKQLIFPKGFELIEKQLPSAFFNSDMLRKLKQSGADSCVVTGLTTSGCVRATAVDALQNNYPTVVISNACGDRNHEAHKASLHDFNAKYGLVMDDQQWMNSVA